MGVCSGGTGAFEARQIASGPFTCMQRGRTSAGKQSLAETVVVVLHFIEALGNESVNWPLPVVAPPSQCTVAARLRHGSHCQRLTCTSLLFLPVATGL